jgi:hypothetical protein
MCGRALDDIRGSIEGKGSFDLKTLVLTQRYRATMVSPEYIRNSIISRITLGSITTDIHLNLVSWH